MDIMDLEKVSKEWFTNRPFDRSFFGIEFIILLI